MCVWLMDAMPESGLYNVGSGKARSFLDLARALFAALGLPERIEFVDTPADIRDKYQYFTEANMDKLRRAGYATQAYSLEDGIHEYVTEFLANGRRY
jgi:ADP-L-glycero-D-manno-heptose 6-epimerase